MKLVPLGDKVVLKKLVAEETTKSGIVLPGQDKEKPAQGEVIAAGPGGVLPLTTTWQTLCKASCCIWNRQILQKTFKFI